MPRPALAAVMLALFAATAACGGGSDEQDVTVWVAVTNDAARSSKRAA